MIRPLSWFLGYFPSEFELAKQIKLGMKVEVPWQFWLYIVAILILAAIGINF
jgi:hypothetical protein